MNYRFFTVDAFCNEAFQGAPILVFPQAEGLTDAQMLQIACEFNFAETVYCFNPGSAEFAGKLRVFTPRGEIPFAGHPTIGAVFVLAHTGAIPLNGESGECLLQEGPHQLQININKEVKSELFVEFAVTYNPQFDSYTPSVPEMAKILHLERTEFDNGLYKPLVVFGDLPYLIVPLIDSIGLQAARFSHAEWLKSSTTTTIAPNLLLFCPADKASSDRFYARLLGPDIGLHDDPPVGTAVPAFAAYLNSHPDWKKHNRRFTVQRGIGRDRLSTLKVGIEDSGSNGLTVRVGGNCVLVSEGSLYL